MNYDICTIFSNFQVYGDFINAHPYGTGHINDTFLVITDQAGAMVRYILQRINHYVFPRPDLLMENVERICRETHRRLKESGVVDAHRKSLTTIASREGKAYHCDEEGNYWRLYFFIEDAVGYDVVENPQQAYQAALAFGTFQKLLTQLPGPRLHETIPGFHDTPSRFRTFIDVLELNEAGRKDSAAPEIDFYCSYRDKISQLIDLHKKGILPERITHNDTKLNNVLLDIKTDEAVCVIDLDTAMPGLSAYDFGDLVRTSTSSASEDERDLSKVHFHPEMFSAIAEGFLKGADFLLPAEKDALLTGAQLMTYEVGLRFLTDYLSGDRYFKTASNDHNLVRCRTQMALVKSMENRSEELQEVLELSWRKIRERNEI